MLNKDNQRMLCYVSKIDDIVPIEGYDRVEQAILGGWRVIINKADNFQPGDLCVYFEIDSLVNAADVRFAFLQKRKYRIKTLKMCKTISQGLVMPLSAFPEIENPELNMDLTELLKVKYYVPEDNTRKANVDPYRSMKDRHSKLLKKQPFKWMMKYETGRKILLALFGKKNNKTAFPTQFPFITKSDEERCENIPFILQDKDTWVKTTKIDGTSSLFLLERKPFGKTEYWVCSRNVRQLDRNQACYHQDNVYWEVEDKYNIRACLADLLKKHPEWKYVAIQGESAGCTSSGAKIQGDPHKFGELRFFTYNFITSDIGRWGSVEGRDFISEYNIPWVPIVDENYVLPDDFEEFKASADGNCEAEGASGLREGYVYRRKTFINSGINSFKNVSRQYLLKNS